MVRPGSIKMRSFTLFFGIFSLALLLLVSTIPVSGEISGGSSDQTPGNGSIQVLTGNMAIQISIDGNNRGVTPLIARNLSSGSHDIRLVGDGFDQDLEAMVQPQKDTVLSIDPETRQFCLSYVSTEGPPDQDPVSSFGLTDYAIILGAFLGITLVGAYATRRVAGKIKESVEVPSPLSSSSVNDRINSCLDIVEKVRGRGVAKTDLVLEPQMMTCDEGATGEVVVRAINCGSRPILIEGQMIPDGESRNILIRVPVEIPGDQFFIRNIPFIDEAGREFIRDVLIRYRVRPVSPALDWSFVGFVSENNKTTAIVRMKNSSSYPVMAGDIEIPPDTEGEIEFPLDDPDSDQPEVSRILSVNPGADFGEEIKLRIVLPYNYGVLLQSQNLLDDALSYYNSLFSRDSGSADLWVQKGMVLEKLGKYEDANFSYHQALEIDPDNLNARKVVQKSENDGLKQRKPEVSDTSNFPSSLLELYTPVASVSSDQSGDCFLVKRAVDASVQMVKVISPDIAQSLSFDHTITVWRSLQHPHILRLVASEKEPVSYLVTNPPEGAVQKGRRRYSLADLSVPVPRRAVVKIGLGLCRGLSYLHHQGFGHYLLAPSEVFIDRNLHIRIGGFDNAAVLSEKGCSSACWILAPEQISPEKYGDTSVKTDIFQAGALLYLLLTGSRPYGRNDHLTQASEYWDGSSSGLVLPSLERPDLGVFDILISRTLSPDPNVRYGSFDEMLSDIESIRSTMDTTNGR